MRIRVVAVGTRMPAWVETGVADYTRRMPPDLPIEWRPVKAEVRSGGLGAVQCQAREAQRIRDALPVGAHRVVLDEHGPTLTSTTLAHRLADWRRAARPVALIIGGPDGLDASLLQDAHEQISLSALTLPHAIVRVILAEQLYRAWSILAQHPYHRE